MEKFDVVIIGGGPGGYPAAIRSAQLGASVALIEKEHLGGTCLNFGCIPTKTLIASSDLLTRINRSSVLGLKMGTVEMDYTALLQHKDDVVINLRAGIQQLLNANKIKVFSGTGSFAERNRIVITPSSNDEEIVIQADHTILATGSESMIPNFVPQHSRVVDSKKFLALTALPSRLLVLGGGIIGCELACMAGGFGIETTVVELLEDIVLMLDPDIRRELKKHMEKELGIRVLTGAPLEDIKAGKDSISGKAGKEKIEADLLLVATGRRAVTEGLALEKAGLESDEAGFIEVDEYCRTKAATVYAIGDVVAGNTQLAHAATSQGITAAENICSKGRRSSETLIPACIFTAPEIGSVGLTEREAKERGISIKIGTYRFAALGKAMATGETTGFVKWVADAETDQLLGAHVIGAHATELISEAVVAIRAELTVAELARTVHCHPTLSEAWMEAAHAVNGDCIHAVPSRK